MVSVPYRALPDVGKDLGNLIEGKVVIDTCNPLVGRDGEIANWAREKGAGLASAELLPGARLVRAFNAIGGRDYGRVDVIVREDGQPVVLEVNTLPGMTETSLLPKAAAAVGIGFRDLCSRMLELAIQRARAGGNQPV